MVLLDVTFDRNEELLIRLRDNNGDQLFLRLHGDLHVNCLSRFYLLHQWCMLNDKGADGRLDN